MKTFRFIAMLFASCFILSCNNDTTAKKDGDNAPARKDKKSEAPVPDASPSGYQQASNELTVYLQPFDNFTEKEAAKVTKELGPAMSKIFPQMTWHFEVLPNKPLPEDAYYKPRNRYLANVLLKHLGTTKGKFIFGLTHKDISFKIHGYDNYGIRGLTPIGGNNSIVSNYRAKGNEFIMVMVHEFLHGYSKAPHCKNPECLMCDHQFRKGKPMKIKLCEEHNYIYPR